MRSKEANDYRYFPDPDLLPVVIEDAFIEQVQVPLARTATASASASSCSRPVGLRRQRFGLQPRTGGFTSKKS